MTEKTYRQEVIEPNDLVSKLAHRVNRESYANSPAVSVSVLGEGFRGLVVCDLSMPILEGMMSRQISMLPQNDGAGRKPGFATLLNDPRMFHGLGHELLAMCDDDISVKGGMPVYIMNQIDTPRITEENLPLIKAFLRGFGRALQINKRPNVTGETAVMDKAITAFCDIGGEEQFILTWSGASVGIIDRGKAFNIDNVKAKMPIVGLVDPGQGCNGSGNGIKIINALWGSNPADVQANSEAKRFVQMLCIGTPSFANFISEMNGYSADGHSFDPPVQIVAAAHITGGGIWKKGAEVLPPGIGAKIDRLPKSKVLASIQHYSFLAGLGFNDKRLLGDYHGACRAWLVCKTEDEARLLISYARTRGITAIRIGETTSDCKGEIHVKSPYRENRWVSSKE